MARATGRICVAAFLAAALAGCGDSMLIKDDDAAFADAQARLVHTADYPVVKQAPPAERALFLQAESFYRYRFAEKERSTGSYAAEAAAAVTDFPAFQSLAGSLDLLESRYRAPDNAAQLWETFLERYPDSKLRPLTLYRLGWAYRSVGARGLPRDSPDQAFDQLIREHPGTRLASLAHDAKGVAWKSKSVAMADSLIPGLPQLYLGKKKSGAIHLGIAALAVAAILTPTIVAANRADDLSWQSDWSLLGSGLLGVVVLSMDYSSSYRKAMNDVVRLNEKAEHEFVALHPDAP